MPSAVVFWIACTLLVLGALAVLLRALLRGRASLGPARDDASTSLFRDQKRQLDEDLAEGAIDSAQHRAMVDELALRLGREIGPGPGAQAGDAAPRAPGERTADAAASERPAGTPSGRRARSLAIALAIVLPVASAGLYLLLGHPQSLVAPAAQAGKPVTREGVLAMIDTLARRMKENPADPKGWALLGRSYAALGRYDDAVRAYAEAVQRAPGDAGLLADYADVLAMSKGTLQGAPDELAQRALAANPRHPKALALAASAAAERDDVEASIALWRRLQAVLPPQGEEAGEVAQAIAELEGRKGPAAAGAKGATGAVSAAGVGGTAPGAKAADGAAPGAKAGGAARIAGEVALAPALAARASPDDTVFVFARAVESPRMPLAVLRLKVRDLPHAFVLDDSMAMAPGASISSARRVVVEARVSKSGNATPAAGDLVGRSGELAPGTTNIHLLIDSVNP